MINDLTFAELRLANLTHPHRATDLLRPKQIQHLLKQLDDAALAKLMAEMIIQIDWEASQRGIDLVLAIRNRYATGETLYDEDMKRVERKRSDDLERKRSGT